MTAEPLLSGSGGSTNSVEIERFQAKSPHHPTIRLRLWLENQGELFFGIGRAQLLFNIQSHGSIKKAAQSMGMSYRAAWQNTAERAGAWG